MRLLLVAGLVLGIAVSISSADTSASAVDESVEAQLSAALAKRTQVLLQQDSAQAAPPVSPVATAVSSFYQQRDYKPVWLELPRLQELITALEGLYDDGLDPEDYALGFLKQKYQQLAAGERPLLNEWVEWELLATNAYLRALYHLLSGKVDPAKLDPQWNFELHQLAPEVVAKLMNDGLGARQIADVFAQARPQHPIYHNLKTGLARYRALAAQGGWPALPTGTTLKPCMIDPQVALLRERLQVTGEYQPVDELAQADAVSRCVSAAANTDAIEEPVSEQHVFDEHLVAAVKRFQQDQYLDDDGAVGPATRAALNISAQARVDQIRVNLDRARWLLHNIPEELLLVDIAGFKITYYRDGQPLWKSRVQVGMSYRTTPVFRSEVNYITLNPTWTVPPTILRKDILPKLRKDLSYLREHNIRVLDVNGRELDPATIDWSRPGNVMLRQDAGADAALGKAVIRFPNPYAVFLHDTPHQRLFNKSQRAFSSGCIRVERALELVELLLQETPNWDDNAIKKALATGKTHNVTLAKRVPIMLAYWTVDAVDDTKVAFKPDIYARDPGVLAALNQRVSQPVLKIALP